MTLDEALADPFMQMQPRPRDFWPVYCCVVAKHEGIELGFAISRSYYEQSTDEMRRYLDGLLESIWQASEMRRLGIPNPTLDDRAA